MEKLSSMKFFSDEEKFFVEIIADHARSCTKHQFGKLDILTGNVVGVFGRTENNEK